MSQYRAYFVPGAMDPYGMVCSKCICADEPGNCYLEYISLPGGGSNKYIDDPDLGNSRIGYKQYYKHRYRVVLRHTDGKPTEGCTIIQDLVISLTHTYPEDVKRLGREDFKVDPGEEFSSRIQPGGVAKAIIPRDFGPEHNEVYGKNANVHDTSIKDEAHIARTHPNSFQGQVSGYKFEAENYVEEAPSVKGWYKVHAIWHWDNFGQYVEGRDEKDIGFEAFRFSSDGRINKYNAINMFDWLDNFPNP